MKRVMEEGTDDDDYSRIEETTHVQIEDRWRIPRNDAGFWSFS